MTKIASLLLLDARPDSITYNTGYWRWDMRLSNADQRVIRAKVAEMFGEDAEVRLFGSRVDDRARGGDIDLFVEVAHTLDNLNRMEKLNLVDSVADWLEARSIRNRLVHEYLRDPAEFAAALVRSRELVPLLVGAYNSLTAYARERFATGKENWPAEI